MLQKGLHMLNFMCDYTKGMHPAILEKLLELNDVPFVGYGCDEICESAKEKIRKACGVKDAGVFFTVGGTQTNAIVIDSMLRSYEGVVSADTGHVNVHEAGAIEYTGHKVMHIPEHQGKMDASELRAYLQAFRENPSYDHMVFPGMAYISHPTEAGTLYTKAELTALSEVCREYGIPLYLDGARLGYGLMSRQTDVTLQDVAELCDVFYIGGTKVGAQMGEAIVFTKNNMPEHFLTIVKQHGALMAKGWMLGVQFDTLFTNGLYFDIGRYAIGLAEKLKEGFAARGYQFMIDSPTNQQFIILDNGEKDRLMKRVLFEEWEKMDEDHTAVRFAVSWSTKESDIDELFRIIDEEKKL